MRSQLGSVTSQNGSRLKKFKIMTSSSVLSSQNIYPYKMFGQNDHFIEVYSVLDEFCVILGVKLRPMTSQKWSRFQKLKNLTSLSVVSPQKHTHTKFEVKTIILSCRPRKQNAAI